MVNISESLLNVVIANKPKVLTGLDQKRYVAKDRGYEISCRRRSATGEKARPTPFIATRAERGKPVIFP